MGVSCREEFQCSNFCFQYTRPYKFIRSQWRISQESYIVWRLFWALWHVGWLVVSIQQQQIEEQHDGVPVKWLIYLTNLSYAILTVQSCLHTGVICYFYLAKIKDTVEENLQWYLKILWLLTTLGFDTANVVTVLYWTLCFDGEIKTFLNLATHAINAVYVLTDIFVIAAPVRLLHFIYPMMYGTTYSCFTYIYYVYGGTNTESEPYIYKTLDWSKPRPSAIVSGGSVFVAFPVTHLLQFGLYALRLCIAETSTCYGKCANLDQDICRGDCGREDSSETKMAADVTNRSAHILVQIESKDESAITSQFVDTLDMTETV